MSPITVTERDPGVVKDRTKMTRTLLLELQLDGGRERVVGNASLSLTRVAEGRGWSWHGS